jgi:PAS domain S-box-containing protein
MLHFERIWDEQNRGRVLALSGALILATALLDWWTKPYLSLGFVYLFPIMLMAGFLPRWSIVLVGIVCATLAELFSSLGTSGSLIRLGFEILALAGCGLFVGELIRNRRLTLEGQERLRVLVETSPAAIVTIDERGFVELANRAAVELIAPVEPDLRGYPIAAFLPELHHALRREDGPQFRASMQCRCRRGNGEAFPAEVWFSTYKEGRAPKLAAIIMDMTEERAASNSGNSNDAPGTDQYPRVPLSARELDVLRFLVQGFVNKEIADRMKMSESGVKNTLQQLFSKAGVRTRGQLVRVALEQYRELL